MSSTSKLAEFAARVRGAMGAFMGVALPRAGSAPSFDQLSLELFGLQFEQNSAYRRYCVARKAKPENVGHWTAIPAIPAKAFKEWNLSCLSREDWTTVFHSSGTTGQQPSRHFHNEASLEVYEASLLGWFGAHFRMANGKWQIADGPEGGHQMAILTPPPAQAPHSSLVHMFETIRRRLGAGEASFVGNVAEDGGWSLKAEAAVGLLGKASGAGQPLLVLGTAFSFVHLLDFLAERGLRFALAPGSCALETGGYKGRSRALPKQALHTLISQRFGIPGDHVICEYGMSELSSQAYDWAIGTEFAARRASRCFRFPPWARVQIISPETGCEVGDGETGLIRIFDLANVWSVMAIQTEDLGVRHGDGFTLAGRAVRAEPRGCSLMAV
jgi:hypothetical protein